MGDLLPVVVLSLVLQAYFLRYVFSINRRIETQDAQIKILILMAKKMGVSKEDIDDALKQNS